jgi:hypothetical protein
VGYSNCGSGLDPFQDCCEEPIAWLHTG